MRKSVLGKLLGLLIVGSGAVLPAIPSALLAAPVAQKETQAPGFYRMKLGDLEVTALYDGFVTLDTKLLKGLKAEDIQSLTAKMFQEANPGVQTSINAYLVNTGKNLILVDAGLGNLPFPASKAGHIKENIKAAGYKPEDIDIILLTHLHADHSAGISQNGKRVFPKATVYVAKAEADFWLSKEVMEKAPAEFQAFFKQSQDAVAPYQAAGKLKIYANGDNLLEGLEVIPAPGHTPGHASYLFSSKDKKLLLWGDVVHNHAVQFSHPEVFVDFDTDGKLAIESRKKLFAEAAAKGWWVGSAHIPFPGIGHVRADGAGAYAWVPAEYSPIVRAK